MSRELKKLGVIFSVVLNLALIGTFAWRKLADQPRFAYEEVGVSAEQRLQLEAGRDRFLEVVNQVADGMIQHHVELLDLLAADSADDTAIQAKLDEIRTKQKAMQQAVVSHLLESRQVLNPDQQKQFFAVLKDRIRSQGVPGPPWLPRGVRERK